MKCLITNFRQGRHTQNNNEMIIKVDGCNDIKKASELIDKEVIWKSPKGKEMKGIIVSSHGNNGAVRVRFRPGLPGQAIGTLAEVK
jgi:large subunit ribosomal protein L35Ae